MKARQKAKGKPGKSGPASSRLIYSRPPLRSFTRINWPEKAKPSEGAPQGPADRGFAAAYSGASSVASALNLPQERDFPKNRVQANTLLLQLRSKPDISTLQRIGHFYFALTARSFSLFARDFYDNIFATRVPHGLCAEEQHHAVR